MASRPCSQPATPPAGAAVARALELHEQALSLAAGNALERGRALAALGDDQEAAYHGDEAFEAYLPALELLRGEPGADLCARTSASWPAAWLRSSGAASARSRRRSCGTAGRRRTCSRQGRRDRRWLTVLKGNIGVRRMRLRVDDQRRSTNVSSSPKGVDAAERLDHRTFSQSTALLHLPTPPDWDRTLELARRDIRLADRLDPAEQAFAPS